MKWTDFIVHAAGVACAAVFLIAPVAYAADDDASSAADAGNAANAEAAAPADGAQPEQKPDKFFYPLVRCDEVRGAKVEVLKPRDGAWIIAEEKKFYPLGSAFRVTPGVIGPTKVSVSFGIGSRVLITNAAEFATREIAIGDAARTIELRGGLLEVSLPRTLKDGLFNVATPHFMCCNMAGDSRFEYAALDDGDEAVVRVVTGTLAVKGRHYLIERMGAANQIRIRTTKDALFTSIRGESGDCLAKLDQGLIQEKDYETGEVKEVAKTLEFQLSPLCAIKIFRAISKVGGRMVVSMMTFAPNGQMTHRCAYAENRSNVNSGELVVSKTAIKEAGRKASEDDAEATEAVDVAVPVKKNEAEEEAPAAEPPQNSNEEEKPAAAPEKKDADDLF